MLDPSQRQIPQHALHQAGRENFILNTLAIHVRGMLLQTTPKWLKLQR
jgi:hypothetical protein